MKIEVVVYSIAGALRAQEGGADRIELCAGPGEGGITPSFGTVEVVRQNLSIDLYAMVRPREGDFLYSSYEFHAMKRDITQFQKLSVDGLVFGILNPDGTIDKKRCGELIARCRPLKCTCHRAFDMTRDPFEALEDCIEVGFDRILTSGQRAKAIDGASLIADLQKRAEGRIVLMAGSGVNEENVRELVSVTRVEEIHLSAIGTSDSKMTYHNDHITGMGSSSGDEYSLRTVDPARIRTVRELAG